MQTHILEIRRLASGRLVLRLRFEGSSSKQHAESAADAALRANPGCLVCEIRFAR